MSASALFDAVERQDLESLAKLLHEGQSPNVTENDLAGWTPLHHAIEDLDEGGDIETVRVLLSHGANVNGWDATHSTTALIIAVANCNLEATRVLLGSGANPNVTGEGVETPLQMAVENRKYELAKLLLKFGAAGEIDNFGGDMGMTALGMAASQLDLAMIRLLVDAGAKLSVRDDEHRTARDHLPERLNSNRKDWLTAIKLLTPLDE